MNLMIKNFKYKNQEYPLEIKWDIFKYEDLALNIAQVRTWCKEGCTNYNNNGGCPPFSPTAVELLKNKELILLTCKINTDSIKGESWEVKNSLIENILRSFMDSLGYKIKDLYGIQFLSPGYCRGCNTCTIHSSCAMPARRSYCITGTGIMLGDVIERLFNEKLQWYKEGSEPKYTMKIMGFISDNQSDTLSDKLLKIKDIVL